MLDTLDLNQLKTFYLAVKHGTFSRTAQQLKLSQSAITRQIQRLETRLGFEVFKRSSRYLILTAKGDILYRTSSQLFEQLLAIDTELNASEDQEEGLLIVAAPDYIANSLVIPYLNEFMELYPKLKLEIKVQDSEPNFNLREADIAVCPKLLNPNHIEQEYLMSTQLGLYAHQKYLDTYGIPQNPEELTHHHLLAFGEKKDFSSHEDLNWHLLNKDKSVNDPYLTINSNSLLVAAEKGIGIISWQKEFVKAFSLPLVAVLPENHGPKIDIFIVFHKNMENHKKIHRFKEFYGKKVAEIFGPQSLVH
jgi:DNA-binding transcriptional LysR family regulator